MATDEIQDGLLVISSELSTFPSVVKAHLANWTEVLMVHIQRHLFLCFSILVILVAFSWGRHELFASKQAVASAGLAARAAEQAELTNQAELMEWLGLKDVSPQNDLSWALKIRHKGTGTWFLREPVFQNWVTSDNSVLWVRGGLGSGKTVLTATVLEYLHLRNDRLNVKAAYTYFYISYQESEGRGFRSFLRSTTRQLLTQCGKPCIKEASNLRLPGQFKLDGDSSPTNHEYIDLLKSFSLHFERVWMVVDGLDESSEVNTFVDGLADLTTPSESRTGTRFQVLMTSRNEVKMKPLQQLAEAISVQPGDDWFSQDRVAYNPVAIVERLGGLATVYDPESNTNGPQGPSPPAQYGSFARFAHYSVREYLGSEYLRRHKTLSGLYFNTSIAHLNAALTCLQHFSLKNFQNQYMAGKSREERRWRMLDGKFVVPHEFYTSYAIPNWQYHLVESKVDSKEALENLVLPHLNWFLDPSLKDQQYCVWEHWACPNIRSFDSSPNAENCRWYYATRDGQDSLLYLITPGNKDRIVSLQKERYE